MENELPIGWIETELQIVSEILDNLRKPVNSTERGSRIGNIPYYGATGQAGWIDDYLFDEELVLVGEDGAPFFDKTKNVAYLINGKSWVNNHAHVLKAISKISSNKFLLHFLNQFDYKDFVGGTTRLKLTQSDLKIIPVPLPPLPEQQRIVAKLDTLFGHLDALKTRLDRIPLLLKDFRQKVLTQAVTGKLTEEWREEREFEEYTELIKKIFNQRQKKYEKEILSSIKLIGKKPKRPTNLDNKIVPLEEISASWDLPKEWGIMPLAFCSSNSPDSIVDGPFGSSINVNEDYIEIGTPVVRMVNIRPFKYVNDNLKYVKTEKFLSLKRHNILPKDVLIAKVGATIGDCCVYPDNFPEAMLSTTGSCRIRVDSDFFDFKFIELFICQQKNVLRSIASQTAQPFLNMQVLRSFPLIVMHKQEQQEIVRRVESLFAKADQIEARYQKLKAKIEQLPQALLAKAFRGELVEQLSTDGDARELLEQIKRAKEGLEKGGKSKKMKENGEVRMVAEPKVKYGKKI